MTYLGCSPCLSAPYQKRQYYWMRAVGPITAPAGNAVHCHALAYLSDRYLFGTLARIYGLYDFGSPESSLSMQKTIYGRGWCANEAAIQDADSAGKIEITKMLSLDHTMYFHKTGGFRADEWLLFEMQTPWADDERALIVQKVFTGEGSLVATCVQEGMLRIKRKSDQTERLGGELQQLQAMTGKGSSSANDSKI
jgi:acyl-CoA thioesterase 8